jgi:hypothetical protein
MLKKLRHSKFKNTGILFELLTKQLTSDIVAGREDSKAKDLLFKYFKENTELSKEWRLYNFLLSEKIKDESHADRYLSVIVEQRKKLSNSRLTKEKYELIKEIKTTWPIGDLLKSNVKNYRTFASIFKLFEDSCSRDVKFDVNEICQARTCVIESMNRKYKDLDENQKTVLREYINNISNTNSLGAFITEQIDEVKAQLTKLSGKISDNDVIKIKINEVIKQLDKVRPQPSRPVKDNQVTVVLLSYELLKEIRSQVEGKKDEKSA